MNIIFAQGNPGPEYQKTRHNIGWEILDSFTKQNGGNFVKKDKFLAEIAEINQNNEKILLVKPLTFYNETGRSLRALVDFYKIPTTEILVIHDELAINFGRIRIRHHGSDAGNNGIKSINSHIGSDYLRLRIGILNDNRPKIGDANFVLSKFSKDEQAIIQNKITPKSIQIIDQFIKNSDLSDESFSV